jgi:hypothetical protein
VRLLAGRGGEDEIVAGGHERHQRDGGFVQELADRDRAAALCLKLGPVRTDDEDSALTHLNLL